MNYRKGRDSSLYHFKCEVNSVSSRYKGILGMTSLNQACHKANILSKCGYESKICLYPKTKMKRNKVCRVGKKSPAVGVKEEGFVKRQALKSFYRDKRPLSTMSQTWRLAVYFLPVRLANSFLRNVIQLLKICNFHVLLFYRAKKN